MIKIIKIGNITLDNALFLKESFNVKNVKAVSFDTVGGNKIIYESIKRDNANNITLESLDNGWIKENTLKEILLLANNIDLRVLLHTSNGHSFYARFRLEENDVIQTEQIYEGSIWYKVTILMAYA